jgi:surfeit locus 1 family protein
MLFRTSVKLTLPLLVLALLFARLGLWQLERKAAKEDLFREFESAPALPLEQALAREQRFARVEAIGRYDVTRHILLDNRILNGRAGVHVLTPFTLGDGTTLLVNRGWLPLPPDRLKLPEIWTSEGSLTIRGRLNRISDDGLRIGEADVLTTDQWPQLVTYLDLETASTALGTELAPWLVQLDADDSSGFADRQWKAAVMEPAVHGAYAFQWFSLFAAAIIIWIVLGVRRAQTEAKANRL